MPFVLDSTEPTRFFYGTDQAEWIDLILLDEHDLQAIRDRLGVKGGWQYLPNTARDGSPLEAVPVLLTPEQLEAFNAEVNVQCIPAWRIIDDKGSEIPHTPENVNLMMNRCRAFRKFVDDCRKKLRADLDKREKDEIKNS